MIRRLMIVAVAALAPAGCSTLTEGTTQNITVTTTPPGALCTLTRDGQAIATISQTPGTVTVDRSTSNILVTCHKGGFGDANYTDQADLAAATLSNIMTAGVGFAVDFASGAGSKYNGTVDIDLTPADTGVAGLPPLPPPRSLPAPAVAALPAPVPSVAGLPPPRPLPAATPVAAPLPPPTRVPTPVAAPAAVAPASHRVFGIGVITLDPEQSSPTTPKHGVVVVVVQAGSPAARAGLAEGDIVTRIGNEDIAEKGDIQRVISALPAGAAVPVHVVRGNRQLDLSAQL
jgi:hypothetical protein